MLTQKVEDYTVGMARQKQQQQQKRLITVITKIKLSNLCTTLYSFVLEKFSERQRYWQRQQHLTIPNIIIMKKDGVYKEMIALSTWLILLLTMLLC